MGKLNESSIAQWAQTGQTYNEEWGVDSVHIKKINGKWVYVQLEWNHRIPSVGFILYDGSLLENLRDLPEEKKNKSPSKSAIREKGK